MFTVYIFLVFADLTETEKLTKLCERLKYKHAREPVILFIEENDITTAGDFEAKVSLKESDDFHIISTITPLDHLIKKYSGRDPDQNIQVYLTYRDKQSEENLALRDTFQAFVKGKGENVKFHISKYEDQGEFHLLSIL